MPRDISVGEGETGLLFRDERSGLVQGKAFPDWVHPVGFLDRRHVLLAQQSKSEKTIHLLAWDIDTNQASERMAFRAERGTLRYFCHSSLRPDGHYLVLMTPSRMGKGVDIWTADLLGRTGRLVIPNIDLTTGDQYQYQYLETHWAPGHAIISGGGPVMDIDLTTFQEARQLFTVPQEAQP